MDVPAPLLEKISKGYATLFLGAGASREANFPGTLEISNHLADRSGYKLSSFLKGKSLEEIAEFLYYEDGYGKRWVRDELIDYFNKKMMEIQYTPSEAHNILTKIKWNRIYTTNYDRLVEITYTINTSKVQRIITIVDEISNIYRRDSEVLQYIKLNGCILAAEKDPKHEIVITHSEQIKNKENKSNIYNLLKQDSINGSIIFIGFNFKHPGSNMRGTSPEYVMLERILEDFGSLSNTHYCIVPYDEKSLDDQMFVRKLKSNNIIVINSKFEEFIKYVYNQITNPPKSLKERDSIQIKLSNSSIEINPDTYSKDSYHFELLGEHLINDTIPSISDSLNGKANWSSYYNKHFIERECKDDLINLIKEKSKNSSEIITITASKGWGKTTLLKDISIKLSKQGHPILWLNPHSTVERTDESKKSILLGTWDNTRIDRIIGLINDEIKNKHLNHENSIPIIVADNIPEKIEELLHLYRFLSNNKRDFLIVNTMSEYEYDFAIKQYEILISGVSFKPEGKYDYINEFTNLINHCTKNKVALIDDEAKKEIITKNIIESRAQDSILLSLHIIFDKNHRPFSEIIQSMWDELKLEYEQKIVYVVASMNRFGSEYYPRLYTLIQCCKNKGADNLLSIYYNLLDRNIIFEEYHNNEPCVRLRHPLIAEQILLSTGKKSLSHDLKLIELIDNMSSYDERDLSIVRNLLKQINEYNINLTSEDIINNLFEISVESLNRDWVVCQQYSKYLLNRENAVKAYQWNDIALLNNIGYPSLIHQKGNILRRMAIDERVKGNITKSDQYVKDAKIMFSKSRFGLEPNEYGYVTHLDLLLYLLKEEKEKLKRDNILAEGAQLYYEGLQKIPTDKYNQLLHERFKIFDIKGNVKSEICDRIKESMDYENPSIYAIIYLSNYIYEKEGLEESLEILNRYINKIPEGIMAWVYKSKYLAKEGRYAEASQNLHSAKLRLNTTENTESLWLLYYLDLIISVIRENYKEARTAVIQLIENRFYPRRGLPNGYIWKESSRSIPKNKRNLREHAVVFTGQIIDIRSSGNYGRIKLENISGEQYYLDFLPYTFGRRDLRKDEFIDFAIRVHNWGLRAETLNATPFLNTYDDYYVAETSKNSIEHRESPKLYERKPNKSLRTFEEAILYNKKDKK